MHLREGMRGLVLAAREAARAESAEQRRQGHRHRARPPVDDVLDAVPEDEAQDAEWRRKCDRTFTAPREPPIGAVVLPDALSDGALPTGLVDRCEAGGPAVAEKVVVLFARAGRYLLADENWEWLAGTPITHSMGVSNFTLNVAEHNLQPGAVSGVPVTLTPVNISGVRLVVAGALEATFLGGWAMLRHCSGRLSGVSCLNTGHQQNGCSPTELYSLLRKRC